jgi:hypothetical protein
MRPSIIILVSLTIFEIIGYDYVDEGGEDDE